MHDEGQVEGRGRVLDQYAGKQRAAAQAADVDDGRDRGCSGRQFGGAASITAAVAVPVKIPADNPESTRPTSRSGTESATRKVTALPRAKTAPATSIGRRPTASDQRPKANSANNTPPA